MYLIDLKRSYNLYEINIIIILFVILIYAFIIIFRITLALRVKHQNLILKAQISTPIIDLLFLLIVTFKVIITLLNSNKLLKFNNVNYRKNINSFRLLAVAKTKTRLLRIRIVLKTLKIIISFDRLIEVRRDFFILINTIF